MCETIFNPNSCDSSLSPWCWPVNAIKHSANPINPTVSVPCLITSCNVSSGESSSEPCHIPCPIKNGKFLTFLFPCICILSRSWSITKSIFSSKSSKNSSIFAFERPFTIPCFIPNLGRLIVVNDKFPLPLATSSPHTFPITLVLHPIYVVSVSGWPGLYDFKLKGASKKLKLGNNLFAETLHDNLNKS